MTLENAINVYTDGSSFSKPRSGGAGICLVIINSEGHEEVEDVTIRGFRGATNNQMELFACIKGLKAAKRHTAFGQVSRIAVFTDSMYVTDNKNKAFFSWSKNHWRNSSGKPVENADLWKELLHQVKTCSKRVDFYWIKGHSKSVHNKAADKLAKKSARGLLNPSFTSVNVRRKRTSQTVERGSVPMNNQRASIHVITDEILHLQKCYRYKYEIISKKSPFLGNVDIAYSEIILRAGHCYYVSFCGDNSNPTILKVFKEIPKRK